MASGLYATNRSLYNSPMMFDAFERMVAFRYLRAKRQEGFISVIATFSLLGIMLGVGTLIVVMSIMNGFRAELFSRVLGLNGHISISAPYGGPLGGYEEVLANLKDIPGITQISPLVEGQALVTGRGTPRGVLVRGLPPEAFRARPILSEKLVAGDADDFRDNNVAIGRRLAEMLGARVGEEITLLSPESKTSVFGSMPRYRAYTIAAIFDVGMYEYDSGFVFMPLEAAQIFYQMPVSVSGLEVFTDDPYNLTAVKQAIMANPLAVRMADWKQQNASFTNALEIERTAMFFILSLIIAVAAFNIFSSMYMQVKVKGRDIAILRTMGASRGAIARIFFMSGMLIGIIGTGLGVLGAWAFSHNINTIKEWLESLTDTDLFAAQIYFLDHLPAQLDPRDVMQVVAISLLVSFIATLMPAWRAARLDPVEALRYE